jgi:hypothetical protein
MEPLGQKLVEIVVAESIVGREGVIVESVHCPSTTRVVGPVVGAESNKCLKEGQQLLGETMHNSSIMKGLGMLNVLINVSILVNIVTSQVLKFVK